MSLKLRRARERLQKKAQRGFRGYPVGTVAYFGPDRKLATKIIASIVRAEGAAPGAVRQWQSDGEIREDPDAMDGVLRWLREYDPPSLAMLNEIVGCPHEEGADYPAGEDCPQCPAWQGQEQLRI